MLGYKLCKINVHSIQKHTWKWIPQECIACSSCVMQLAAPVLWNLIWWSCWAACITRLSMSLSLIRRSKWSSSTMMWCGSMSSRGGFRHPSRFSGLEVGLSCAQSLIALSDLARWTVYCSSGTVMSHLVVVRIIISLCEGLATHHHYLLSLWTSHQRQL